MSKPSDGQYLALLAQRYGIETEFLNAHGKYVAASAEAQRQLLAAMGLNVVSEEDSKRALASLDAPGSKAGLPSVIVAKCDDEGRCCVDLRLPNDMREVSWVVQLEDGTHRAGLSIFETMTPAVGGADARAVLQFEKLPWGYHHLEVRGIGKASLIVTPGKCWLPDAFHNGAGLWGISTQIYLLRSAQNWGVGDFRDLAHLVEISARHGCAVIGVNPLHQMKLDSPEAASPYSPLTRLFLNALYISVPDVPGYNDSTEVRQLTASNAFRAKLASCRDASHVDYSSVLSLKIDALRILYCAFVGGPAEGRKEFEAFRAERGEGLHLTSIFQALRCHFSTREAAHVDWRTWPDEFQDPFSASVAAFAAEKHEEIKFLEWLQWLADSQFDEVAKLARDRKMTIGLYRDLAVGCDASGAETWLNRKAFLSKVQVGAPPDILNPSGQNWGLPPFDPNALQAESYLSFVELLRANMRHSGGLRIDHVMGLQRLYCIPDGCTAADGAYLRYPFDDLLGILALESQRARCIVVGEDLGTVPEGFREKTTTANVLSYRVLFFEQADGVFLSPQAYPRLALAVAGSHDLPLLAAWLSGKDIELKEQLDLYSKDNDGLAERERRQRELSAIHSAFSKEGIVSGGQIKSADAFTTAAHDFLSGSQSLLVMPQLDDLLGEVDPVNVPATILEYPNWRRRYRMTLEEIAVSPNVWARCGRLQAVRGKRIQETRSAG